VNQDTLEEFEMTANFLKEVQHARTTLHKRIEAFHVFQLHAKNTQRSQKIKLAFFTPVSTSLN
jgi:hypothetical protein